jgi:peptide deformylase
VTGLRRADLNYKVLTYGNEILRKEAEPVEKVTDEIRELAKDMISTMYASNGVGLAAEQVGRTESMCVLDVSPAYNEGPEGEGKPCPAPMPLVLINPQITESEGESVAEEGCLSFPDIFVPVKRPERIVVKYMDLEGDEASLDTDGFLARAIQHEMDHLHGVLLYDHMSPVKRVALAGRLRRLKKGA